MKDSTVAIIFICVLLNFLLLYGNWCSTDNGFLIDDPTAGSIHYRYEESWKWNPNPMTWLGSILGLFIINFALLLIVLMEFFIRGKSNLRRLKISDVIVCFISGLAALPVILSLLFSYAYMTYLFAKQNIFLPWRVDQIISITSVILYVLLIFFFMSIGQSIWDIFKKEIFRLLLFKKSKEGK